MDRTITSLVLCVIFRPTPDTVDMNTQIHQDTFKNLSNISYVLLHKFEIKWKIPTSDIEDA